MIMARSSDTTSMVCNTDLVPPIDGLPAGSAGSASINFAVQSEGAWKTCVGVGESGCGGSAAECGSNSD